MKEGRRIRKEDKEGRMKEVGRKKEGGLRKE